MEVQLGTYAAFTMLYQVDVLPSHCQHIYLYCFISLTKKKNLLYKKCSNPCISTSSVRFKNYFRKFCSCRNVCESLKSCYVQWSINISLEHILLTLLRVSKFEKKSHKITFPLSCQIVNCMYNKEIFPFCIANKWKDLDDNVAILCEVFKQSSEWKFLKFNNLIFPL